MADAISTCAHGYAQAPDEYERAAVQLRLLNAEWRRLLRAAGFTPVGMQCYVGPAMKGVPVALERG